MNEKKGIYEKAKEEMRLSERILAELPGFRGYKEKELRRESDKLIRNHIYKHLINSRDDLKKVFQKLSDSRLYEVLTDMDRLIMHLDRVSEKINHASYGYSGFFNIVKIEEEELDKMITFDIDLLDYIDKIAEESKVFEREVVKQEIENIRSNIQKLSELLETLERAFDEREELILGVK